MNNSSTPINTFGIYFREVNQDPILQELNEAQRKAAAHIYGPMMVIAGAGSGKTRVLTYRIAHLIRQGIDPFHILALTFTNKAAKEMKNRIAHLVGEHEARNLWMGTFHSIFARVLRIESERINYPSNFSIYDTQDSRSLLKDIIKELNLEDNAYKPALVHHRISSCKNNLISPEDYLSDVNMVAEDRMARRPELGEIYRRYDNRLLKAGAMDFDDLLFKMNVLLRDFPDVLVKYQHKFQFLLVDEYQDTNFAQYLIIRQLAAVHENLCVVGDDAQSIYAFRGANIQNILNFQRDYPDFSLYKLEQNYRSTKTIVDAANSVIANNQEQIRKEVWTHNDSGHKIQVHKAASDNDEGYFVANSIFYIKQQEAASPSEFAILYRTNAQSRSFEEALRKLNIPYKIYGGMSFYQRKEIKDLIAYFRLVCNPNDEEAFKRIINYPKRGIGETTIQKLMVGAADKGISLWEMLQLSHEIGIAGNALTKLHEFVTLIKSFQVRNDNFNAYDTAYTIASESGLLKELYTDRSPEGVARYENVQGLLNGVKEFSENTEEDDPLTVKTLADFLIDVALLTDVENEEKDAKETVSLMTIHAAKGLEFPYVFIVGLEENLFPSQLSLNSREDLEEERRLFYVALTRAEKKVTLSYALTRFRYGQLVYGEPSRFMEEIDSALLEMPMPAKAPRANTIDFENERQRFSTSATFSTQNIVSRTHTPSAPPANFKRVTNTASARDTQMAEGIAEGTEVIHEKFGKGKVLTLEGDADNRKATIFFPSHGQKQLLLKFAKLKVL